MPEAQLDDLALVRLQLGQTGTNQPLQLGLLGVGYLGRLAGRVSRLVVRIACMARRGRLLIGDRRAQPAQAFAAGHRIQPRAQLGGRRQVAKRGGDDEGFLHGLGRVGRLRQHPAAVAVEVSRIPVVCHADAGRVPGRDRRDNLAVVHGHTVVQLPPAAQSAPLCLDYRLPRLACSRSIASNSALKLPLPNPSEPCRSISSKNTVGRSCTGWVKICSR